MAGTDHGALVFHPLPFREMTRTILKERAALA
jgi:hypothetical protein